MDAQRGRREARRRRGAGLAALTLLAALGQGGLPTRAARAGHGGVVQLRAVPAGPYTLSVWTQPVPPRPGDWRVDVAVMGEAGAPVLDAAVRVRAEPLGEGGAPAEAEARRDADPLGIRHRARLTLGPAGPWRVTVSVAGPGGSGAVTFPVDVEPARGGWWLAGALGAAVLAGAAWVAARRRRRSPAPAAPPRRPGPGSHR